MDDIDPTVKNRVEEDIKNKNRFEQLSEKVILTSKERDDALAKVKAETDAKTAVEKERDFFKDFSANISKYPGAGDYQDKILEKVKSGYSTEDAMVVVMAKEGKLSSPNQQPSIQVEGGSAPTLQGGTKSIKDMTSSEKFAALSALPPQELINALRG